jgi:signal transduction histidine kinase
LRFVPGFAASSASPQMRAVEFALAFASGLATFTVVAVALAALDAFVLVALIGAAGVAVVVAIERTAGIAYAVPAAMAALLAFDWFQFPPIHPRAFPGSADLADLLVYVGVAVLVGELAAYASRRAELSEKGRAELAEEQAALRRVATLVARGVAPAQVFAAVAEEAGVLLAADAAAVIRYQDDVAEQVAVWSAQEYDTTPVTRAPLEGTTVVREVWRSGRGARIDDYARLNPTAHKHGIRSAVGAPITVDGRLWGVMIAWSLQRQPLPATVEDRLTQFTDLVATAISNTEARRALAASRARIVAATDAERRRVVRDLHDGAQQRLVHTVITLKLAGAALDTHDADAPALVTAALHTAEDAMVELRELAHGILPSVLTFGGLPAAVNALASRMPLPVDVDVSVGRLPQQVEATAYFLVAETLTNVAKHSQARRAEVTVGIDEGALHVLVRDDGVGGAQPEGNGLQGLADRVAVLDGQVYVGTPPDGGTLVTAIIPLADVPALAGARNGR